VPDIDMPQCDRADVKAARPTVSLSPKISTTTESKRKLRRLDSISPGDEVDSVALHRDRVTVVTLSTLSQSQLPGNELHSGFYAADSALVLREDATGFLK